MWLSLFIISTILLGGYAILIEKYRSWFLKITPFTNGDNQIAPIRFSVIIPARNEEKNIKQCLSSILTQNYPADYFEVIVINDHSTDATAAIISAMQQQYTNLLLLNLEELLPAETINSYKKKAIELAIQKSTGDWIVTTDADCYVNRNWLVNFNAFIKKNNSVFVAAPVKFANKGTFLSTFQSLDFISLQGITAASVHHGFHSMCNGANLAYSKHAYKKAGGFAGIDTIASGDDMLLMHKIYKHYPGQVHFLLSATAIVKTEPMPTWGTFINQRIRWASKADKYDDKRITGVLLLVYLLNFYLFVLGLFCVWKPSILLLVVLMWFCKTIIELRFMIPVAAFFNETRLLYWFPLMQPFHILYTVVAGWLGKFGSYKWKGRAVR